MKVLVFLHDHDRFEVFPDSFDDIEAAMDFIKMHKERDRVRGCSLYRYAIQV